VQHDDQAANTYASSYDYPFDEWIVHIDWVRHEIAAICGIHLLWNDCAI
jgi:hypothetical protein